MGGGRRTWKISSIPLSRLLRKESRQETGRWTDWSISQAEGTEVVRELLDVLEVEVQVEEISPEDRQSLDVQGLSWLTRDGASGLAHQPHTKGDQGVWLRIKWIRFLSLLVKSTARSWRPGYGQQADLGFRRTTELVHTGPVLHTLRRVRGHLQIRGPGSPPDEGGFRPLKRNGLIFQGHLTSCHGAAGGHAPVVEKP